jgi:hypothetical protein
LLEIEVTMDKVAVKIGDVSNFAVLVNNPDRLPNVPAFLVELITVVSGESEGLGVIHAVSPLCR